MPRAATLITAPLVGDSNLSATDLAAPWGSLRNFGSHTTYNRIRESSFNMTRGDEDIET